MTFANTVLVVIWGVAGSSVGPHPVVSTEALLSDNLVDAEVLTAVRQNGFYLATSEITHVYKGDHSLIGRRFGVTMDVRGSSNLGLPAFIPPLKKGDKVIWLLQWEKGTLTSVPSGPSYPYSFSGGLISLPVRKGEENRHLDYVLAWTRAVESAVRAEPAARYDLLKKYAHSDSRPVVEWAVCVLAEVDPRGSASLFREWIGGADLTIWQKVMTEQALAQIEVVARLPDIGWTKSPERLGLYQSWARGRLSDEDANEMQRSLALIAQSSDSPKQDLFSLLKAIVERKEFSDKTRAAAVDSFRYFSREATLAPAAFEFLLALVTPKEEFEVQLAAARNIRHFFPKEAQSRRKDVEKTRGAVNDKTVSKLLEKALDPENRGTRP